MTFSDFADPDETAKILFVGKDNTDTAQAIPCWIRKEIRLLNYDERYFGI